MSIFSDRSVRSFALLSSALSLALFGSACGSSEPAQQAQPRASSSPALPAQERTPPAVPDGPAAANSQPEGEPQPEATPNSAERQPAALPLGDAPAELPASNTPETPAEPVAPPVDSTHGSGDPTNTTSQTTNSGLSYLIDAPAAA